MDHIFDNVGIDASLGTKLRVPNKDYASFPSAALHQGGFHFDTSTNAMYYSDGTTWTKVGIGTVTGFSAGGLSPLFTTSVDFSTTTPHLNFILNSTVSQYQVFGRSLSGVGPPDWVTLSPVAFTGAVTSVGLTASGALSVAGSPITTSGTIALNWTGTSSQYVRGDGSLATFPSIPSITPSALTKTNDTNVTLTLGGTPATALLEAVSLTLGWTGILAIGRGGTGLGTLGTVNQLLRVNSGGTALEYFSPTWTSNTGTVTSVAASVGGTALGVSGTPITSSGTLAFAWAGTSGQYVDGQGNLQNFPSIPAGTVTSVGLSMPTGFTVSGSPITSAGTLAVSMAAGYVIPTTTQVGNWNTVGVPNSLIPFGNAGGTGLTYDYGFSNTTTLLKKEITSNSANTFQLRNNDTGSLAYVRFLYNAYGNSWGIGMGSYAANANAIEFRSDAVGANTLRFKIETDGNVTAPILSGSGTRMVVADSTGLLSTQAIPSIPAGTVTSVGLSMPTGFTVSGSPITSAGTLAVSMAAGYVIPTTTQVGNWNTVGVPNSLIPFGNAGGTGLTYDYGFSNTTTLLKKEITSNSANTFQLRNNDTGSLAYVRFLYNAYGNSWGIGMGSYAANANAIEFRSDAVGANTLRFKIETDGNVTAPILSGSGTRMVVADINGLLSTQPIPSGSNSVWYIQGTATDATTNAQDIVRTGRVRIGATGTSTYMLSVVGDAYIMNGSIINNNMSYAAFSTAVSPITLAKLDTSNRVQLSQSGVDIILPSYLSSRADSISPVNFLCTTASGVLQSRPVSDFTSSFAMTYASSDVTITSGGGWVNLTFPNTNYALNTTSIYSVNNAGVIVIPNVIKYHRIDVTLQWETTSGTSGSPVIEVRCQVNNTNIYNNPTFTAKPTGVGDIIKCHFYTASTGTVTISCRVTSGASCYIKTRTLSVEDRGNAPG